MMVFALLLGAMMLGASGLGYYVGKGRRSDYEKTRDKQYRSAVRHLDKQSEAVLVSSRKVLVYERALNKIATGNERMPEITASLALDEFN